MSAANLGSTPSHRSRRRMLLLLSMVIGVALIAVFASGCQKTESAAVETTPTFDQSQVSDEVAQQTTPTTTETPAATSSTTSAATSATTTTPSKATGIVAIDAGHGDTVDTTQTPIGPGSGVTQDVEPGGTSGVATGNPEYKVNYEVALKLQSELESRGITVVMVHPAWGTSMSSEERAEIANASGAQLFIRLHCDGIGDSSRSGFTALVPGDNEWTDAAGIVGESYRAASIIEPYVISETGAVDDGIVTRTDLAGFNFCTIPVVLFEMGYMSNPDEDVLLGTASYQQQLAAGMANGIVAYLQS